MGSRLLEGPAGEMVAMITVLQRPPKASWRSRVLGPADGRWFHWVLVGMVDRNIQAHRYAAIDVSTCIYVSVHILHIYIYVF